VSAAAQHQAQTFKFHNDFSSRLEHCGLPTIVCGGDFERPNPFGGDMDKRIAGLLGAAAALTTVTAAQAAAPLPAQATEPTSYRDLLNPVPNAVAALRADDVQAAQKTEEAANEMQVAERIIIQHHHHHHHHVIIRPFRRHFRYHHHHHHHHHY